MSIELPWAAGRGHVTFEASGRGMIRRPECRYCLRIASVLGRADLYKYLESESVIALARVNFLLETSLQWWCEMAY